jgi:hypothetical protein
LECQAYQTNHARTNITSILDQFIVFLQAQKVGQSLRENTGSHDIGSNGEGLWNGVVCTSTTNRWSGGTAIPLNNKVKNLMIDKGTAIYAKAQ